MRKQQGMTLIGMLLTMAMVVFVAIVLMRIVPVVIKHYTIVSAIHSLDATPVSSLTGDPMVDVETLNTALNKRFEINGLDFLNHDELIITPDGEHQFKVKLKYSVTRPLVYNIGLLFNFDRTIEVVIGSEN